MIVTFSYDRHWKRLVADAALDEYDGVPLTTRVWFSGIPALPPREFLPLIGLLCFRPFVGISFGCRNGIPVFLRDAMGELSPRPEIQLTNLDLHAHELYAGYRTMRVCDLRLVEALELKPASGLDLIVDGTGSNGSFHGANLAVMSTNAFLNLPDRVGPQVDCLCACALAAAPSCGARHMILPRLRSHQLAEDQIERLGRALRYVGMTLEFQDCGADPSVVARRLRSELGAGGFPGAPAAPPPGEERLGNAGAFMVSATNGLSGYYTLMALAMASVHRHT
jgi:hypothetical protein